MTPSIANKSTSASTPLCQQPDLVNNPISDRATRIEPLKETTQPVTQGASSSDMRTPGNTDESPFPFLDLPDELRAEVFQKIINPSRTEEAIRSDLEAISVVCKKLRNCMVESLPRLNPRYALGMALSVLVSYVKQSTNLFKEGAREALFANTTQTSLLRHIKYKLLHQVIVKDEQSDQLVCKILEAEQTLYGFVSIELGQLNTDKLNKLFGYLTNKEIHSLRIVHNKYLSILHDKKNAQLIHTATTKLQSCTQIKKLILTDAKELIDADLERVASLVNLTELDLSGCWRITDDGLAYLAGLTQLKNLNLSQCSQLFNLLSISNLSALKELNLSGCSSLTNQSIESIAGFLTGLEELNLAQCNQLTSLQPLAEIIALKMLSLSDIQHLSDDQLQHLTGLTALEELNLSGCQELTDLSSLATLVALKNLDLSGCKQLTDLSPLSDLSALKELNLSGCSSLTNQNIESIAGFLTGLEELNLAQCNQLTSLQPLAEIIALKMLNLSDIQHLSDDQLQHLTGLTALEELNLSGCQELTDLSSLATLVALKNLDLSGCKQLTDLSPLSDLRALNALNLSGCVALPNPGLESLAGLVELEELNLAKCNQLTSLQPLTGLTKLKTLDLSGIHLLNDEHLQPLANLTALESLSLARCVQLSRLDALGTKPRLKSINLNYCKNLGNAGLADLAAFTRLEKIHVIECNNISNQGLQALINLKQLQTIDYGTESFNMLSSFFDWPSINRWDESRLLRQIDGQNPNLIERYSRIFQSIGIALAVAATPATSMLVTGLMYLLVNGFKQDLFVWDNTLSIAERLTEIRSAMPTYGPIAFIGAQMGLIISFTSVVYFWTLGYRAYRLYSFNYQPSM